MSLSLSMDNTALCPPLASSFLSFFASWSGFPGPIRGLDGERVGLSLSVLSALNAPPYKTQGNTGEREDLP